MKPIIVINPEKACLKVHEDSPVDYTWWLKTKRPTGQNAIF